MSDAKEFLEGWFAALYRFDGLIVVLQAFFDETGGHESHEVTAVAGFVYDKSGLMAFTEAWAPMVEGLSKPYRTSSCNWADEPFESWENEEREGLMNSLAKLSTDHALAAFVVGTGKEAVEAARENGPGIHRFLDTPYTMCVVSVLSMVSSWAKHTCPGKGVYCWFEAGGPKEEETAALTARLSNDPETEDFFSAITGRAWAKKKQAIVMCSADLLAWEWQRNVRKPREQLTPRMSMIIDRMSDQGKHICPENLSGDKLTVWSLSQIFSGDQAE